MDNIPHFSFKHDTRFSFRAKWILEQAPIIITDLDKEWVKKAIQAQGFALEEVGEDKHLVTKL